MNIHTAKKIIEASVLADDSVIMSGLHGIGKSAIVKQFCKEHGYHLTELFLSHQEVGDLIGIPHIIEKDNETITTWSKPIWLQRMEEASKEQPCLLFLDELNRAPLDVRQASLQLVLEKHLHEHSLPSYNGQSTLVVSAMNPSGEYQVEELDQALLDRFLYIDVEADAQTWLKYARNKGLNEVILNFISEFNDRIHYMPKDGSIGTSPRSWEKLSDFIQNIDKIDDDILFPIITGKLGTEVGAQFYSYLINFTKVVKVEDIEKVVNENVESVKDIEELSKYVSELINDTESIRKTELAYTLADLYMDKDDILVFLTYLYALPLEICVSFLKSYRSDEPEKYKKLAKIDTELNGKELFKRVIRASKL